MGVYLIGPRDGFNEFGGALHLIKQANPQLENLKKIPSLVVGYWSLRIDLFRQFLLF